MKTALCQLIRVLEQLLAIEEKRKNFEATIQISKAALEQGWAMIEKADREVFKK